MPLDSSLRERFWRDVAAGRRDRDPHAIHETVEDMMYNHRLDGVPGFETASLAKAGRARYEQVLRAFRLRACLFSRASGTLSSWGCFSTARPIFVGPAVYYAVRGGFVSGPSR